MRMRKTDIQERDLDAIRVPFRLTRKASLHTTPAKPLYMLSSSIPLVAYLLFLFLFLHFSACVYVCILSQVRTYIHIHSYINTYISSSFAVNSLN
ncbi:hypothetical protein glysoja_021506, partial [Glycine soja]